MMPQFGSKEFVEWMDAKNKTLTESKSKDRSEWDRLEFFTETLKLCNYLSRMFPSIMGWICNTENARRFSNEEIKQFSLTLNEIFDATYCEFRDHIEDTIPEEEDDESGRFIS